MEGRIKEKTSKQACREAGTQAKDVGRQAGKGCRESGESDHSVKTSSFLPLLTLCSAVYKNTAATQELCKGGCS